VTNPAPEELSDPGPLDASFDGALSFDGVDDYASVGTARMPQIERDQSLLLRFRPAGVRSDGAEAQALFTLRRGRESGLVLALDRGGSCTGMAFRLAGVGAIEHLDVLWRREMAMGSYRPAWLPCTLADGRRVDALAFVMRRDAASYTGKLADPVVRTVLGCASGRYGTTLDYVSRTVEAPRESGMPDRALEALLKRCQAQGGR